MNATLFPGLSKRIHLRNKHKCMQKCSPGAQVLMECQWAAQRSIKLRKSSIDSIKCSGLYRAAGVQLEAHMAPKRDPINVVGRVR